MILNIYWTCFFENQISEFVRYISKGACVFLEEFFIVFRIVRPDKILVGRQKLVYCLSPLFRGGTIPFHKDVEVSQLRLRKKTHEFFFLYPEKFR